MELNNIEKLVKEIYDWCVQKDLWGDSCIYFNNKAWASWSTWNGEQGKKIAYMLYEYSNKNPRDYFPGGDSVIACSFEGTLNHVLNGYVNGWVKLENEFNNIFDKYGLVFEMYNSWNGNAYYI